jgi:hypothetical protein
MFESFDIADAPRQSTHRVGRSATGFKTAVYIRAVENGECVTVIFAQTFLHIGLIYVEVDTGIAIIIFNRFVAGATIIKNCEPGYESNKEK